MVKSANEEMEIQVPRVRDGFFEPQVVKNSERILSIKVKLFPYMIMV